jgi:hypothetical protein
MRKYSDEPEERAAEEQCERDIQSYGLHILKVTGDDEWPEFAYTVGLFHSFNHPEVIVLGLPGETAQAILNNLADVIRSGKRFAAGDQSDDLVETIRANFLRYRRRKSPRISAGHSGTTARIDFLPCNWFTPIASTAGRGMRAYQQASCSSSRS